jgi:hypothetical protein
LLRGRQHFRHGATHRSTQGTVQAQPANSDLPGSGRVTAPTYIENRGPLGEEHGFDAIEQQVFQNIMGGMFSARDLETRGVEIRVSGNAGWSEFHWIFHATMRRDGATVTTHGVETQVYRRESGKWRLVHVHYSEDRQSVA